MSCSLLMLTYSSFFIEELRSLHYGGRKWHASLLLGVVSHSEHAEGARSCHLNGCKTLWVF